MVKMFLKIWNDLLIFLAIKKPVKRLPNEEHDLLYDSRKDFPTIGKLGNWYMDKQKAHLYIWDGTSYVEVQNAI